jgi:hypothetical protein
MGDRPKSPNSAMGGKPMSTMGGKPMSTMGGDRPKSPNSAMGGKPMSTMGGNPKAPQSAMGRSQSPLNKAPSVAPNNNKAMSQLPSKPNQSKPAQSTYHYSSKPQ